MFPVLQVAEHGQGLIVVVRFAQHPLAEHHRGIGAQHRPRTGGGGPAGGGFFPRHAGDIVAGGFAGVDGFVNARCFQHREGHADLRQ